MEHSARQLAAPLRRAFRQQDLAPALADLGLAIPPGLACAMATEQTPRTPASRLEELRNSAKGWHGVQLAVLGFIGFCGVLKGEGSTAPGWMEALAGILVLAALAIALYATYLVGRAAWPLYGARGADRGDDATELARTSRRLTTGLALTFLAIALLAVAGTSSWWPSRAGSGETVQLQAGGASVCGELAAGGPGTVRVETDEQPVEVPIDQLDALQPVDGC
jgi:hypothetical protein